VGSRAVLDTMSKRKIPSPRRKSNPGHSVVQPVVSRYTDWAIQTKYLEGDEKLLDTKHY